MKPNHSVGRSNVNENVVNANDFPKSGFDLTYRTNKDFVLGMLTVGGYQHIMPADKFSGNNDGEFTFNDMNTPQIGDIEVSQHNFYLPYRAIDRTFEDGLTPTKLNGMSVSWRTPSFKLNQLVAAYIGKIESILGQDDTIDILSEDKDTAIAAILKAMEIAYFGKGVPPIITNPAPLKSSLEHHYLLDWLEDYKARIQAYESLVSGASTANDARFLFYDAILTPLFGERSLLCSLGYNWLRRSDLLLLSEYTYVQDTYDYPSDVMIAICDDCPQCEYALRAYYAVWYEHYRDINLEPVSATLPKWKDFGSTSVFGATISSSADVDWAFLCVRYRSWYKDMFVSSQPDDICRHVFAPVLDATSKTGFGAVDYLSNDFNYENAEGVGDGSRGIASYRLEYRDPITGSTQVIRTPLPKSVNDALSTLDASLQTHYDKYLDLYTLRHSNQLEQYLKRNFYFGDEYKDRMLAHYGSKVSDMRINRPELLSSSIDSINRDQVKSSVSTSEMNAGERTMTATAYSKSDGYSFFAEEFGIVLNIITFMPRAQYAGICPQNLLSAQTDFPLPEFANSNEEFGRVMEVATNGLRKNGVVEKGMFGHYPYAHAWRSRVDEVQDSYLSDKQDWTFRRYFGLYDADSSPKLNYQFIHCRPNLGMFRDSIRFDGQLYGSIVHNFFVERVLPTPVENI